jgi:hypothetical protein
LLLSVPGFLQADLEVLAINSIREASATFRDQCAAQKTGCAMQARFLAKVADNYENMKAQSVIPGPHHNKLTTQDSSLGIVNGESSNRNCRSPGNHDIETMAMNGGEWDEGPIDVHSEMICNYTFSDDEMWEKMFAEAGFRLNDGVFMPEAA